MTRTAPRASARPPNRSNNFRTLHPAAAGFTKDVRITLNRAGRRLLAKDHTLKVKLTITENGHTLFTRTIVFKAKPAKKSR